jgi:TPR repeat protein
VETNMSEALKWYRKAAEQDDLGSKVRIRELEP